jgi:hypothetical protein
MSSIRHPIVLQGCRCVLEGAGIKPVLEVSDLVSGYRFYFRHHPDVAIVDLRKHGEERGTLSLIRRIGRRPQTAWPSATAKDKSVAMLARIYAECVDYGGEPREAPLWTRPPANRKTSLAVTVATSRRNVRVTLDQFQGKAVIDIRTWFLGGDNDRPADAVGAHAVGAPSAQPCRRAWQGNEAGRAHEADDVELIK